MFRFGKKKHQEDQNEDPQATEDSAVAPESPAPKKGKMDKLIMGAILGVAVGSVVGAAVTSQKGKETIDAGKKLIGEKQTEMKKKKGLLGKIFGLLAKKKPSSKKHHQLPLKKIPREHPAGDGSGKEKM